MIKLIKSIEKVGPFEYECRICDEPCNVVITEEGVEVTHECVAENERAMGCDQCGTTDDVTDYTDLLGVWLCAGCAAENERAMGDEE